MGEAHKLPEVGTWRIDPAHSVVGFVARHLMVTKVRGRFTEVDGAVIIGESPETSKIDVTIHAGSIDTGTTDRDDHLRSPDFLDVERFPELTFHSTGLEVTGDGTAKVTGDLTIRDVTNPVVLDVEYDGLVTDPWGNTKAAFTAATEIDREDWGLTWNVALESGGVLVGKKVSVELEVQIAKVKAGEAAA